MRGRRRMSRKSRRAAVSDGLAEAAEVLQGAGETVVDTVAKSGRKARKQAAKLAAKAADALPANMRPAKPKHRKRKVAIVVIVLAGAGVAAKKLMGGKSTDGAA